MPPQMAGTTALVLVSQADALSESDGKPRERDGEMDPLALERTVS